MNCNFDLILKSASKMVNLKCCNGRRKWSATFLLPFTKKFIGGLQSWTLTPINTLAAVMNRRSVGSLESKGGQGSTSERGASWAMYVQRLSWWEKQGWDLANSLELLHWSWWLWTRQSPICIASGPESRTNLAKAYMTSANHITQATDKHLVPIHMVQYTVQLRQASHKR
jgi:hypothetical protein